MRSHHPVYLIGVAVLVSCTRSKIFTEITPVLSSTTAIGKVTTDQEDTPHKVAFGILSGGHTTEVNGRYRIEEVSKVF